MRKKQGAESFGVIGLGRFGTALAITIAKAGKDVIVIDRNEAKVKELRQYTDYAFVVDELNSDSLREVGIQNCDTVIVCIGEKMDTSILTTMCVVEMGIPHVIAKALTAEQGAVLEKLGAQVVYPERFRQLVNIQSDMKEAGVADFVLLRFEQTDKKFVSEALAGTIRATDTLGAGEDGRLYLLLVQMNRASFPVVEKRLVANGLNFELTEEVG